MPGNVRKDGKARRIALDILGPHSAGLVDSSGKKKRYVKKKEKQDAETARDPGEGFNDFDEVGYQ